MSGRPWATDSRYDSYEDASARKAELLKDIEGLAVKIRRYNSDGTFAVKVRPENQEEPKKSKKKQKKTSRRAKREKAE